ncbi:MAG: hypothetical protein IIA87_00045 [Nanoarchaeota archaeon]|nr:hypothetical protein [Nanoarchaeota archaeon]
MLPKWHILLGGLFTAIIWFFAPETSPIYLTLIFLSSFLIDFDHYLNSFIKNKKLSLPHALKYYEELNKEDERNYKRGIKKKRNFEIFHTIEFHILIAILGFLWIAFFYIFIGMVFHSLLDLAWLLYKDRFYRREYFLFSWLREKS